MKPLVIDAQSGRATATCIISHGLGDSAHGWADAARRLSLQLPNMRFVLPTAPTISVTRFGGQEAPAWFDLLGTAERRDEPCKGLEESVRTLKELIAQEADQGITNDRVALMGFSQGAALSLYAALVDLPAPLAASVAMSGYLPRTAKVELRHTDTPVLQWHGDADTMVALRFGEEARDKMLAAGVPVDFRLVPGLPHSVTQAQLDSSAQWLGRVLK